MKFDGMHSTRERAKKTAEIFIPSQWTLSSRPLELLHWYVGVPLNHEDSRDFKNVASSRFCNTKTDMKGGRLNWLTIKWLRCLKEDPETLLFKYRMANDFKQLKIKGSSTRGRQTSFSLSLPRHYSGKFLLSEVRQKDLLDLRHMGVVPQKYHVSYKPYPVTSSQQIACPRRTWKMKMRLIQTTSR